MEHLEPAFPVLEQGLPHHDHNPHCSLSWYVMLCFYYHILKSRIRIRNDLSCAADALREVRKYSNADQTKDAKLHPNMFDHMHMKLFRAQRNLYISGFSLFLWLYVWRRAFAVCLVMLSLCWCCFSHSVLRRVITLISQLAVAMGTSAALQTQTESANKAAKKYMEDNEMLKQVKRVYLIWCSWSDYAVLSANIGFNLFDRRTHWFELMHLRPCLHLVLRSVLGWTTLNAGVNGV